MTETGELIIEGLLTTWDRGDCVNLSPMGARINALGKRLQLRPFKTSRSYSNLMETNSGVFHITDDVHLIARAAIGDVQPMAELSMITGAKAYRLKDTCRWYLVELDTAEQEGPRATLEMTIQQSGRVRDFAGFNRAKHAVIEAAILATRVGILPDQEIRHQLTALEPWITKTGGLPERDAFALLKHTVGEKMNHNESRRE